MEILDTKLKLTPSDLKVREVALREILSEKEKTIIYFYPKDNTPGCSLQAEDFTKYKKDFDELGIKIVGVSNDSEDSHCKFIKALSLKIDLITDDNLVLHNFFGVHGEKVNFGKKSVGTIRSTFLLNKDGKVLKEWKNVKATLHVEKVLKELRK